MNASSTTAAPLAIKCPPWCVETDIDTHRSPTVEMDSEGVLSVELGHAGPTFGPFACFGYEVVTTGEWLFVVSPQKTPGPEDARTLRQLAVDALAAAEWLEANR